MTGDLIPFPGRLPAPSWEDELAALNARAARELDPDPGVPEPGGCPEPGQWVRAARTDEDLRPRPLGPWHLSTGWQPRWGRLTTRCRNKNRQLDSAFLDPRKYRWARAAVLLVSDDRPEADVCRSCDVRIARDGVTVAPIVPELPAGDCDPATRDAVLAALTEAVHDARQRAALQMAGHLKSPRPSARAWELLRAAREAR